MSMSAETNLIPIRSVNEAREKGKKGGKKSGEARRKKKSLRERLEALLATRKDDMEAADAITIALLEKALTGDVRAYEVIRDTIGEKPADKTKVEGSSSLRIIWSEKQ